MSSLVLSVLGAAALAATDVSVAIPDLACGSEIPASKCTFFAEYLGDRLASEGGLTITTPSQIIAVLGVERQRQLMGCSDNSCVAELAGALGSEVLMVGTVARVGEEFAVTLKAVDAKKGSVLTSRSTRVLKEEGLLDFFTLTARVVHDEVLFKLRQIAPPADRAQGSASRFTPRVVIPGAIGAASLIASGVLFAVALGAEASLRNGAPSITNSTLAHQVALDGAGQQIASGVLLGVGLVAVGVAVVLFFLQPDARALSWFQGGRLPLAWSWSQP